MWLHCGQVHILSFENTFILMHKYKLLLYAITLNCTCNILEANITAHEILNNYNDQKIIVKLEEYLR